MMMMRGPGTTIARVRARQRALEHKLDAQEAHQRFREFHEARMDLGRMVETTPWGRPPEPTPARSVWQGMRRFIRLG